MIHGYKLFQRSCLIILFVIIIPVHGQLALSVEPTHGSGYWGSYKFSLNLSPNDIGSNSVTLELYSPKSLPWKNELIYSKTFKPDMLKSNIECQLNGNDHYLIQNKIKELLDEPGNQFIKENPEKAIIGWWRYRFVINGKQYNKDLELGPFIILIWGNYTWDWNAEGYTFDVFAGESDLLIEVCLKYEEDEQFRDFTEIGEKSYERDQPINEWTTIKIPVNYIPSDASREGGLSEEKRKKVLIGNVALKASRL